MSPSRGIRARDPSKGREERKGKWRRGGKEWHGTMGVIRMGEERSETKEKRGGKNTIGSEEGWIVTFPSSHRDEFCVTL